MTTFGEGRESVEATDVSPDGQRFLMIKGVTPDEAVAPPSLILVQNWFEKPRRLVPTN